MKIKEFVISSLHESPWHFRVMSKKDFDNLVDQIKNSTCRQKDTAKENAPTTRQRRQTRHTPLDSMPVVAQIEGLTYIVDGTFRIRAAKEAGITKLECQMAEEITSFHKLRIHSFKLNKTGYTNPILLSDMIKEDLNETKGDVQAVARLYGVNEEYVNNLVRISLLDDDTKIVVRKVISNAARKYQFLLEQITPQHLSALYELEPGKRSQVVNWLFHDVMYGPSDEFLVSIPSIYELITRISKLNPELNQAEDTEHDHDNTLEQNSSHTELAGNIGQEHTSPKKIVGKGLDQKYKETTTKRELDLVEDHSGQIDNEFMVSRHGPGKYAKRQLQKAMSGNVSKRHDANNAVSFSCSCGKKYEVDFRTKRIYRHVEDENFILKKDLYDIQETGHQDKDTSENAVQIYSSVQYGAEELKRIIKKLCNDPSLGEISVMAKSSSSQPVYTES